MSASRSKELELTREIVLGMFDVDMEGGRLFWRVPPKNHPRLIGTEAGIARPTHSGKSYWVIKFGGVSVRRGRLIFFLRYGNWPMPCLDHADGNSLNDSITNLREATIQQNAMNHKSRAKSSAMPMGVRQMGERFQARIKSNKRPIHLGCYGTVKEASAAYQQKRKELFGAFA